MMVTNRAANQTNLYDIENLRKLLLHFQINPENWIKSLSTFHHELNEGERSLEIRDGKLYSRVNGVTIKCFYTNAQGERFQLFEEKQVFKGKNGKILKRGLDFVAEKRKFKEPSEEGAQRELESPEEAARRGLYEELQIQGPDVILCPLFSENRCDKVEAPDYKGVETFYDTYVFSFEMPAHYYKDEYIEDQEDKRTFFLWKKIPKNPTIHPAESSS